MHPEREARQKENEKVPKAKENGRVPLLVCPSESAIGRGKGATRQIITTRNKIVYVSRIPPRPDLRPENRVRYASVLEARIVLPFG